MKHVSFQKAAARIAATLGSAFFPGGMTAANAHARNLQKDFAFDQLPSICRQGGGVPYVLYEFDDDGSVSHARTSCFGQTTGSWGSDWLCELDRDGGDVCASLTAQRPHSPRGITPRLNVTIIESWDTGQISPLGFAG